MKRMFRYGIRLACLLFVLCIGILSNPNELKYAQADEDEAEVILSPEQLEEAPFIVVEKYELSHERVVPGMGFTLTLYVKNNSVYRTVQQVLLDVSNPVGVTPVYGTVTQLYLGDMKPGESRVVTFKYDAWSSINTSALSFNVSLVAAGKTNRVEVRVPTGLDNIFHVMAVNGANKVYVGDKTSVSVNFRVLGDENVSNVVLRVDCDGETVGTSQVGSLTAGTTKTQSVSFQMSHVGNYTAEFYMEYLGADGQTKSEFLGTKEFEVRQVENENPSTTLPGDPVSEPEPDDTNALFLFLSGVLILLIFIVSAIILKKKR